jgi:hypothetical protein
MSVKRIWHGWTTPENANLYQELLHQEVFPGIESKGIEGYRSVELLRLDMEEEVEFVTIMTFDSIKNVVNLQGADYKKSYIPASAQKLLKRWDKTAVHYTAVEKRSFRS